MASKDLSPAEKLAAAKQKSPAPDAPTELARRRRKIGLHQDDVGAEVGLPGSTLKGFEDGKRMPSLTTAFALADFYGTTVDKLFRDRMTEKAEEGNEGKPRPDAEAEPPPEPDPQPADAL